MKLITGEDFRRVLGSFATGVTVVTAYTPEGAAGMAVNSVTSVSLDPPLVLFCPANSSETWPSLRRAGRFCINVMARHHESLARQFAAKGTNRFAGVACVDRETGPGLCDAAAWIECTLRDEHDGGDHTIVVANVVAIENADEVDPLVFCRGRYGTFRRLDVNELANEGPSSGNNGRAAAASAKTIRGTGSRIAANVSIWTSLLRGLGLVPPGDLVWRRDGATR